MHDLVSAGSQFIVATHSPIILAYPDALIYTCDGEGLQPMEYDDAASVRLTRTFLERRERFLSDLLAD